MTEDEYITVTNLARMRIAYSALHDCQPSAGEPMMKNILMLVDGLIRETADRVVLEEP